jgi:hypothetical protein
MEIVMGRRAPRRSHTLAAIVSAALVAAPGLSAQRPLGVVSGGSGWETYSFADPTAAGLKSVSLRTLPFSATFTPVGRLRLEMAGAFASAALERTDGSRSTLEGLTDTSLGASLSFGRDLFTIGAALLAPTGKSSYTADEAQVAGVVAADLLPFRVSNWGSGGAAGVSSALALPLGGLNLGVRAGYQQAREVDLLGDATFAYRPGDQVHLELGADGSVGDGRLITRIGVQRFSEDVVNGANLYRTGDRITALLSWNYPSGRRGSGGLYAGAQQRQHGVFLDGSGQTPSQTLVLLGWHLRQPFRFGILAPTTDVRLFRNGDGVGQGVMGGAGLALELSLLGGAVTLVSMARARYGYLLVSKGLKTGVMGTDFGAGLRLGR